ncbi:glycerophosphodiester phosphodiesterase family protein [Jatrophihabitans sp. DSM 45814]
MREELAYGCGSAPLAIAHRGGAGLAAENTLEAFGRSYALGIRYLETDIRVTSDGVVVAFHDANLDRVTDGRGPLRNQNFAGLSKLRVFATDPVPTLAAVLEAFPDAYFTIDLKDEAAIKPLAQVLLRTGATNRVCIAGAWDHWLRQLAAAIGSRGGAQITTALGWRDLCRLVASAHTRIAFPGGQLNGSFAHVPLRIGRLPVFGERLIARAHRLGIRVIVWTVDDPAQMHRLLDEGVDGIITDRPDLLREVLLARDEWTVPDSVTAQ